jgi:glyoxylase-like metal-dependent hydrolase (beta-lactamase superfamily II)/8-oxo-dGTP pyrophosphatase MutT (NUDIX family)
MRSSNEATPRAAATIVLLRDGAGGLECLLTTRPRSMRFMGGAAVFPGGAVAAADLDPRWEKASAIDAEEAGRRIGIADAAAALGAYVCALREAYEEVGFIVGAGSLEQVGRADADDAGTFLQACLDAGVILGTDVLVPAGRWVTPLGSPMRFDARFFLARVSPDWEPRPDPTEVDECYWTTPGAALDALARGRLVMAPPTIEMLQRLADFPTARAAIDGGAQVGAEGSVLATAVGPGVTLVLAPNPGVMTGPGTNTYVIGPGPSVVVDPAMDDGRYLDRVLEATGGAIDQIVVTHRHPDHVGGAGELRALTGAPVRAFGDADAGGAPVVPIDEGDSIEIADLTLTVLHTPGHASDHVSLVLGDAIFAGDNILGEGTAVIAPPDGDMRAYLRTLERLRALGPRRIYPGHFRPLDDGLAVIDGYIEHRHRRHTAILAAIARPSTVEEIVARVYADTPRELHPIAVHSVEAHLQMAREEGTAQVEQGRWISKPDE